jgi:citrate synthase
MFEATSDYRADGFRLIAQLPHLVATVINHHAGWGKTSPPEPGQGYVENFVQLLRVPDKRAKELTHLLNLFYLLHLDHGGGNLSTFVGKAVASGLEDMYGSISSALCALAGPRHGRANQEALEMVQRVLKSVGAAATEGTVETFLRDLVARGGLVSGFGHAVLRVEDPRATVQYAFAEKHYPQDALVRTALLIRGAGPKVLKKNPKIADPYPNVDAISGVLLSAAGFSYPEYYAVLFGFARSAGIAIQIIYERCEARGGKGTPIVRPKYIFKKR